MQLTTLLALLGAASLAAAYDPVYVKYPSGYNVSTYCKAWRCACINYVPNDSSLEFRSADCRPPKLARQQGEVIAACHFVHTNDAQPEEVDPNKHIAAATGGTIV